MKLEEKLARSRNWNSIYFFREGIFAQLFGVSLYLAVTQINLSVKVCCYRYKKLNNAQILRAGLPTKVLEKHFQDRLIKHDFGYELKGDWQIEPAAFKSWYQAQLALFADNISSGASAPVATDNEALIDELPQGTRQLWLSEQEYLFLKEWQQDKYPASIESGFIRGLNQKIASGSA